MQLDNIFEDLEAQFEHALESSNRESLIEGCNFIRVRRLDSRTVELVMPLIGDDFLSGMALGSNTFELFRFAAITQVEFCRIQAQDLRLLQRASLSLSSFLFRLPSPFEMRWVSASSIEVRRGLAFEVSGDLIFLQTLGSQLTLGVPIASISELSIDSVENLGADPTVG
jgi:hypothetical protein